MKIVFAGPSLHGSRHPCLSMFDIRPPAAQGDIFRAVEEGAGVIGLIDGVYENVAAVWHKEILYGLSLGVQIFGAASLGALRAAECSAFGMIGIGQIFAAFAENRLDDDAEVALLHGPAELGYLPLSEPLVNVRATLEAHLATGALSADHGRRLFGSAQSLFFKERDWKAIIAGAGLEEAEAKAVLALMTKQGVNQKRADAEALLERLAETESRRVQPPAGWEFARTSLFDRFCHGGVTP